MAMHTIDTVWTSVEKTNLWLHALKSKLGWQDNHATFEALKLTLQTLRDRMKPEESANFAAQLPMVIRGAFYEGWQPEEVPKKWRHLDAFLEPMQTHFTHADAAEIRRIVECVLATVNEHLSAGIMADVKSMMPDDIKPPFP
mgnify:CR=1 FL=1